MFAARNSILTGGGIIVTYLIVAGGASGGAQEGGGGGAGGLLASAASFSKGTVYTITVGAGGAAVPDGATTQGNNGSNSSVIGTGLSITSTMFSNLAPGTTWFNFFCM
jgi:hypothetical protein